MLRFIIQNQFQDQNVDADCWVAHYTLDADVPELEAALTRGGYSETGFDRHRLLGVEVLPAREAEADR